MELRALFVVKHGLISRTKRDAVDNPFRDPDPPVVRMAVGGPPRECFTLDRLLLPDRVEHFRPSLVLPSRSFLFGRFLGEGTARAYLLDGTDVGPIVIPPRARRSAGRRTAPPAS